MTDEEVAEEVVSLIRAILKELEIPEDDPRVLLFNLAFGLGVGWAVDCLEPAEQWIDFTQRHMAQHGITDMRTALPMMREFARKSTPH